MSSARAWLPKEALSDRRLDVLAREAGADWASRWFRASKSLNLVSRRLNTPTRIASDVLAWHSACGQFVFAMDQSWLARLGSAILGLSGVKKRPQGDSALIEALARSSARDLAEESARRFGALTPFIAARREADAGGFNFTLSMGASAPLFQIYVSEALATKARKQLAPTAPPPALAPRQQALDRQRLTLSARVGQVRVGLDAIASLAIGDTLVLDGDRCDVRALFVNQRPAPHACWRWNETSIQFELEASVHL
jgi:hypothetical protein